MLWFSITLLILVVAESTINLLVSRHVLDQSLMERLVTIVDDNCDDIEYFNSDIYAGSSNALTITYNETKIKIDDDFCQYYEGVCTALVDSQNMLLYGESPIVIDDSKQFSYTSVGTAKYKGETYFVYERPLSGDSLDGLWIRGVIAEKETEYLLSDIVSLEIWLFPFLAVLVLIGGYLITTRSFAPVETISNAADRIVSGNDLTKRIDIGQGDDEIHKLANTFNGMFDRLEKSFDAEKQFVSDASHELRTPIAVIKAHTEYALEFANTEDEYKEALKVINRQSDSMSSLLSQLLFFARLEQTAKTAELKRGNLSEFLNLLCDDRKLLLDGKRNLRTEIEENIYALYEENLMARLLGNLLDNAVKYSPVGSNIDVSLSSTEKNIILSVTDTGTGINPDNIEKIWQRFYQEDNSRTDSSNGSFGLGLSMVKEITLIHNGYLEVESFPGEGSCFKVILPK